VASFACLLSVTALTVHAVDNGVLATMTDVSDRKKLEQTRLAHVQERELHARAQAEDAEQRRQDADERRRRQELLIDVTSHELRQPVSAILNCSSVVRSNMANLYESLKASHLQGSPFVPSAHALREIEGDLEGLDAIYQCGLAQERIANDVLSLSRIQLGVLSINPVEYDLAAETRHVVSRFNNEMRMKDISVEVLIGKSLEDLGVRIVRSDKARYGQILCARLNGFCAAHPADERMCIRRTNLLSNGIKFTDMSTAKRVITITLNVARHAPDASPCVPPEEPEPSSPVLQDDEAEPRTVYIYVFVKDSGPGLQPEDLALLFRR
jgi:signal transduction histidine kinase